MTIKWTCVLWEQLSRDDLYDALTLRQMVFAVEQNCAYLDCDGTDRASAHVLGRAAEGTLVAYARIVKPGAKYDEPSIGRVVTHPQIRRTGAGRALMIESIARTAELFGRDGGHVAIRISAQCYLERFYRELGFEPVGEPYSEDEIPHVEMLRP